MFVFVLVIHVLVSIFLIMVVLLQSGKGGDIASAFGGGGTQTVFGPRGSSNVLTKATTISAVVFMLTSVALVILSQESSDTVLDAVPTTAPPAAEAPEQPAGAPIDLPPVDEGDGTSELGQSSVDGTSSE